MNTDEKIAARRMAWMASQVEEFLGWLTWCESPIEQLAMATLIAYAGWSVHPEGYLPLNHAENLLVGSGVANTFRRLFSGSSMIVVQAEVQLPRARYRLDMAMFAGVDRFAVEFDGHDFHERTKEQARKDKARDRALTLAGWRVLRFTGSEVFADPESIVDQLETAAEEAVDRDYQHWLAERGPQPALADGLRSEFTK